MTEEPSDKEYIVFPEEAIKYLPPEWQQRFHKIVDDGKAVLEDADANLKNLNRLVHAFPTMASLRYIQHRLSSTKFEPTMDWALENDTLTMAFVTTYARLIEGGMGSGVSRKSIPSDLRAIHDDIIRLRNKRYAHNGGHESISGSLQIEFENGRFDIGVTFKMGFHVGGANEWKSLVEFLDNLMIERLNVQLRKLEERTGFKWNFPSGPPLSWVAESQQ